MLGLCWGYIKGMCIEVLLYLGADGLGVPITWKDAGFGSNRPSHLDDESEADDARVVPDGTPDYIPELLNSAQLVLCALVEHLHREEPWVKGGVMMGSGGVRGGREG